MALRVWFHSVVATVTNQGGHLQVATHSLQVVCGDNVHYLKQQWTITITHDHYTINHISCLHESWCTTPQI